MSQTDGEKEIILGNKQLISLFFVVVALCGVFFSVGYMIGRNGAKPEIAATTATDGNTGGAAARSPVPQDAEPPRETASDASPAADTALAAENAARTQPARDLQQPSREMAQPLNDVTKPMQPETGVSVPQSGAIYLQVTALRKTDADNLAKTLREQKLPVLIAASSRPDLFRVLVGPYHQTVEVADAKAKLKALGFGDAFVQK